MMAGHYAAALVAHQKYPKGTLLFFIFMSQFQDILWFIFHYLGLEPTAPADVFDTTISNMAVMMVYSHDLIPQIIWATIAFLLGRLLFNSTKVGLIAMALSVSHFVLDFFSGHAHNVFGVHSHEVGFGFYATNAYLAIFIEAVFILVALAYYFREEMRLGLERGWGSRAAIIGVFAYGICFMLSIAYVSFRDLFGLPAFDLGFNTTIPMIIFTYVAMAFILFRAVPSAQTAIDQ